MSINVKTVVCCEKKRNRMKWKRQDQLLFPSNRLVFQNYQLFWRFKTAGRANRGNKLACNWWENKHAQRGVEINTQREVWNHWVTYSGLSTVKFLRQLRLLAAIFKCSRNSFLSSSFSALFSRLAKSSPSATETSSLSMSSTFRFEVNVIHSFAPCAWNWNTIAKHRHWWLSQVFLRSSYFDIFSSIIQSQSNGITTQFNYQQFMLSQILKRTQLHICSPKKRCLFFPFRDQKTGLGPVLLLSDSQVTVGRSQLCFYTPPIPALLSVSHDSVRDLALSTRKII